MRSLEKGVTPPAPVPLNRGERAGGSTLRGSVSWCRSSLLTSQWGHYDVTHAKGRVASPPVPIVSGGTFPEGEKVPEVGGRGTWAHTFSMIDLLNSRDSAWNDKPWYIKVTTVLQIPTRGLLLLTAPVVYHQVGPPAVLVVWVSFVGLD